jgi:hypothetical protein
MSMPELHALWQAELDGRLDANLPPRERFVAWYRRQKREAFMARFHRLPVQEMSKVYLRLAAGEDPDEILKELPSPPSDDAGPPNEGNNDRTSGPRHAPP